MHVLLLKTLDVELHNTQSWAYSLKVQVGIVRGVVSGFVTGIHRNSVRRWNLWFPLAEVFAEVPVLARTVTLTQITSLPLIPHGTIN